jgi:hypothetical protein
VIIFSNCLVRGPVVIQPDFKAAVTSSMIFWSIRGGEKGIISLGSRFWVLGWVWGLGLEAKSLKPYIFER